MSFRFFVILLPASAALAHKTLGEKFRPSPLMVQYVKAGRLGRKAGRGVYEYPGPKPGRLKPAELWGREEVANGCVSPLLFGWLQPLAPSP